MAAFLARLRPRTDRTIIIFPPAVSLTTVAHALRRRAPTCSSACRTSTGRRRARSPARSPRRWRRMPARASRSSATPSGATSSARPTRNARRSALAASRAGLTSDALRRREDRAARSGRDGARRARASCGQGLADSEIAIIAPMFLIAYEPVWAIGTGKTATPGDASAIHTVLRSRA